MLSTSFPFRYGRLSQRYLRLVHVAQVRNPKGPHESADRYSHRWATFGGGRAESHSMDSTGALRGLLAQV
jgi:hypothetical protein